MRPFRLLDLAPELRNNIYEHALTHDRSSGITAAVGLLRTCRQVYSESKPILYEQSIFTISARFTSEQQESPRSRLHRLMLGGDMSTTPAHHESTIGMLRLLPRKMLELPRIHIEIDIEELPLEGRPSEESRRAAHATNRFLFPLVDLLNSSDRPHRLQFSIMHGSIEPTSPFIQITFWPLRKLQKHIHFGLKTLSKHLAAHSDNRLPGGGPSADILARKVDMELHKYRQRDLVHVPLTKYSDIHGQATHGQPDNEVRRLARHHLEKITSELENVTWWSQIQDTRICLSFIAAQGLLRMDSVESFKDVVGPPDWLIRSFRILEEMGSPVKPRAYLKKTFESLSHVIDKIPATADEEH